MRLFFAVYPHPETAAGVSAIAHDLRRRLGLRGRPLATERLHVTTHFLGRYPELPEAVVRAACSAAAACRTAPFGVRFDRVMSFAGGRRGHPLVLRGGAGLEALAEFRHGLSEALEQALLGGRFATGYTPHLTLLYDRQFVDEQPVEPVGWTVDALTLVASRPGVGHEPLGRWPLAA